MALEANLANPDGSTNIDAVIAEVHGIFNQTPPALARQAAYNAAFKAAQDAGTIPHYNWQQVPMTVDGPGQPNDPRLMYLMQLLNPGGEQAIPGFVLVDATVPLPDGPTT